MRGEKIFCSYCGKEQTEIEYVVGQCNDCDPFVDEWELIIMFGEPEYSDDCDMIRG